MAELKVGFGIYGMQKFFDGNIKRWIESIRLAEQCGVDQVSITDHVVMGENIDRYPYGKFPSALDFPWYEPIAMLSAIAARTETIRLSTGVLISPLRPAVLLAKQIATLDVISEGRVDIGIGTGWQEEEYIASGIPFEGRYTRMVEQVRVCRELWSKAPVSVSESTVRFDNIHAYPRPVQGRDVPVWFGMAPTPRNCQRIAELGQGWIPIMRDPQAIADGVSAIKAAFVAAGRDPQTLQVRGALKPRFKADGSPDYDATLEGVQTLKDAGVTLVEMGPLAFCREAQDLPKFYEQLARAKSR